MNRQFCGGNVSSEIMFLLCHSILTTVYTYRWKLLIHLVILWLVYIVVTLWSYRGSNQNNRRSRPVSGKCM